MRPVRSNACLSNIFLVRPVLDVRLYVLEHAADLDVRAAVLGAFERAERRRDAGIGVRTRGRHEARGERGVVTAAVLRVDDEREIEHAHFQIGVLAVYAQHVQDVGRGGKRRYGIVYEKAVAVRTVIGVRLIAVYREHGERGYEPQALTQNVVERKVVRLGVVSVEREHRTRHGVHDIVTGRFHDDVAEESGRQMPVYAQKIVEVLDLGVGGKLPEEQKVYDLLEAASAVPYHVLDYVLDVVAAIIQFARARRELAVDDRVGLDVSYFGQSRADAAAVGRPKPSVNLVFRIKSGVDG